MVTHNSKSDLPLAILIRHIHKKFEINQTKIKSSYQSVRKVVTHNSKSNLPLVSFHQINIIFSSKNILKKHDIIINLIAGMVHGKAFQHVFGLNGLSMHKEIQRGLNAGGFAYLPCRKGGFTWRSRSLGTENYGSFHSYIPKHRRNKILRAVQQFWDTDGSSQNLYLDQNCGDYGIN